MSGSFRQIESLEFEQGDEKNKEAAVCCAIEQEWQKDFEQVCAGPSQYEIMWRGSRKKWAPAFSLIPVKRKYGANISVLQRSTLNDGNQPIYLYHSGFTPGERDVLFTGLEFGTILDFAIPQSFAVVQKSSLIRKEFKVIPFSKDPKPTSVSTTSANVKQGVSSLAFIQEQVDAPKNSSLLKAFSALKNNETHRFGLGNYTSRYQKYLLAVPQFGQTVVVVSSCNKSGKTVREKALIADKTKKVDIKLPHSKTLQSSYQTMLHTKALAATVQTRYERYSPTPSKLGLLVSLLVLEALRRKFDPEGPEVTMNEFVFSPSKRLKQIVKQTGLDHGEPQSVESEKPRRPLAPRSTEVKEEPVLKGERITLSCPECGASNEYSESAVRLFNRAKCQSCNHIFHPKT